MAYAEIVRRFGQPSFEIATGPRTKALAYTSKDGDFDIDLQDDAVIRVAAAVPK